MSGDAKYPIQHPKWTKTSVPTDTTLNGFFLLPREMQLQKAVHYDWILWSSHHFYFFGRLERNEEHARYKNLVHERLLPL